MILKCTLMVHYFNLKIASFYKVAKKNLNFYKELRFFRQNLRVNQKIC